jgi:glutaredoxin 3
MNVKIYTTPTCGYCHQAKRFLADRGVRFAEYDVSRDQAAANEMVSLSGQMGVPVIVVNGEIIVGFDRARLEQLLADGGRGQHISLGLSVADASSITQRSGTTPVLGAFVGKVAPLSLGEKAGIRSGDIITALNLRHIRNADDLEEALSLLADGDRAVIDFLRGQDSRRSEIIV